MVTRTVQYQNGSYFTVIPKALIDAFGLNTGDKVSFRIEHEKIIIAPAHPAKNDAGAATTQRKTRDAADDM